MSMTVTAADAQDKLPDLLNQVVHYKEHIVLTRRGKDIAAIISIEDLQLLLQLKNKTDLEEAMDALKEAREQGSMPIENVKEELGT
ncbi:MAG TPA: type II toxin-antitoxin system prevent-host-death family antitoxin [Gammaproteobacteria bacterium]|nr:type II toxin-antitoxin system prevent-host-death family antitoxin [Gammaproteobacteria bacterium]